MGAFFQEQSVHLPMQLHKPLVRGNPQNKKQRRKGRKTGAALWKLPCGKGVGCPAFAFSLLASHLKGKAVDFRSRAAFCRRDTAHCLWLYCTRKLWKKLVGFLNGLKKECEGFVTEPSPPCSCGHLALQGFAALAGRGFSRLCCGDAPVSRSSRAITRR